jgi:hypothetical protein
VTVTVERPALTLQQIVHDPLDGLLAAVGAEVHACPFTSDGPLGLAIDTPEGELVLVVRTEFEGEARECLVRGMIACLLRLDTSSWPPQIRFLTHTLGAATSSPGTFGVVAEETRLDGRR